MAKGVAEMKVSKRCDKPVLLWLQVLLLSLQVITIVVLIVSITKVQTKTKLENEKRQEEIGVYPISPEFYRENGKWARTRIEYLDTDGAWKVKYLDDEGNEME